MRKPSSELLSFLAVLVCALILFVALVFVLTGSVFAKYKPEYASHSEALKQWFRSAQTNPEARWHLNFWTSCCENSDRVKVKFTVNTQDNGDEWFYQCTQDTAEACGPDKIGTYKRIPPDIIHLEGMQVPAGFDPEDPQVKEEFRQLRADGVLFISGNKETCFWPPESMQ